MKYRRERPVCRKQLLWCMDHYNCTLEELLEKPAIYFTPAQKKQAHKMLDEGKFRTAKELYLDARRDTINRSVGLIR